MTLHKGLLHEGLHLLLQVLNLLLRAVSCRLLCSQRVDQLLGQPQCSGRRDGAGGAQTVAQQVQPETVIFPA